MPMTIQKAIEIKQHYQYLLQDASLPDLIDADNLSIEALKAVKDCRASNILCPGMLMPGETEE